MLTSTDIQLKLAEADARGVVPPWSRLEIETLLAEIPQWRPIETAPKDGKEILVCWAQQGGVRQLMRWNTVHRYWESKGKPELHMQASHWLAGVPATPKAG